MVQNQQKEKQVVTPNSVTPTSLDAPEATPKPEKGKVQVDLVKSGAKGKKVKSRNSNKNLKIFSIVMVVLTVISGIGFLLWQSANSKKIEDYGQALSEANGYYQKHNYASALKSLNNAVAIYPTRSAAYEKTIDILLDKGQYDKAAEVATAAESAMDDEVKSKVWGEIGLTYFEMKDYTNASKFLAKSVEAQKESDYTYYYVMTLLNINSLENVSKYIDKTGSENVLTNWDLYNESIEDADLSLYKRSQVAMELINAGYPYLGINLYDGQEEVITEYWEAQYYLGRAYYDIGKYDKAIVHLESALTLGSQEVGLHLTTARVQYELSFLDESIKSYDRSMAFSSEEDQFTIMAEYLELLLLEKLYVKADAELTRYAVTGDTDWQYLQYLYMYKSGDSEGSLSLASKIDAQLLDSEWEYWHTYTVMRISQNIETEEYVVAEKLVEDLENVDLYDPYIPYFSALISVEKDVTDGVQLLLDEAKDYDLTGEVSDLVEVVEARI
jgi:tetratricopeptide (TPR) repeat protein